MFSLVLLIGLPIVSKQEMEMPGDNKLSSGYSVIRGNMVKINNYENVNNYAYKTQKKARINTNQFLLSELDYVFLEEIKILEDEQYPQGLCLTEDFVFISSYSDVKEELGRITVFDKQTGEYLITLGMDERSHLGGLTYDGTSVWICNSSKMSLEQLSYSLICELARQNRGKMIDARNLVDTHRVSNIPSCVTYYEDMIFVASHSKLSNSKMIAYQFDKDEKCLRNRISYNIPSKVQGVAFSDRGEVYLSTSYGRRNSSFIKKYKSLESMTKNPEKVAEKIELPPCSEGIVYKDKRLYVLFESAGKKYLEGTDGKGKSLAPLDRVLMIQR